MDIEWALSDGRFFIVQARPITTLRAQTPALEEWNDSMSGDYLWTCANVSEAVPDVMVKAPLVAGDVPVAVALMV